MKEKIYLFILLLLTANHAVAQRDISLEESIRLALSNNLALENSRLECEAAERIKISSRTRFFPDISAGAILFDVSKDLFALKTPSGNLPVYDGNPANLPNATQFAYFPGGTTSMLGEGRIGYLDVIQPVYAGGRIVNGSRLAQLGQTAAVDKAQVLRSDIILSTQEQYWRIISLDEKHKTIDKYKELLDRLLNQVEEAYESGVVMRNDVLKVRLKRSEVLLDKSKLENGRKLAVMAFCQHVGVPYDSTLIFASELPAAENPHAYYMPPQTALKNRTEYKLLQKAVKAEELRSNLKLGEFLPSAAVGARAMVTKLDAGERRTLGVFFGTVSIPISDWIGGVAELEERSLKEKIAENNLQNNSELLMLQMEKTWQELNDAYRQVLLNQEAREQAEENLRINNESHRNGLTSVSDLLEAQALYQQACDNLVDAQCGFCLSKSNYLRATGRIN